MDEFPAVRSEGNLNQRVHWRSVYCYLTLTVQPPAPAPSPTPFGSVLRPLSSKHCNGTPYSNPAYQSAYLLLGTVLPYRLWYMSIYRHFKPVPQQCTANTHASHVQNILCMQSILASSHHGWCTYMLIPMQGIGRTSSTPTPLPGPHPG